MTFGRRQPRPQRASAMPAPLQSAAVPGGKLQHCANATTGIVTMLLAAYTSQRRLQPESAIVAAAALTGEFALRSTGLPMPDRKSTRLNSSHLVISYAVF